LSWVCLPNTKTTTDLTITQMCLLPLGRPRPPRKAPLLCSRGCACGPAAVIGPDDGYGRCSAPPGRECGPHRRASPCSSTCKPNPVLSSPHATPAPPTATICNGPAVHGPAAVRQGCEARPLLTGWSATAPHPPVTTILLSRTARTTQQQQQQQFRDHGMTGRLDTLPLVPAGPSPRQGTSSPSAKRLGLSRIAESFVRGTTLPPPSRPTSSQHSRYQNNMNDKQLTSHMPTSTLSDLGNTIEPANPTQGTPPWTAEIYPCTHRAQALAWPDSAAGLRRLSQDLVIGVPRSRQTQVLYPVGSARERRRWRQCTLWPFLRCGRERGRPAHCGGLRTLCAPVAPPPPTLLGCGSAERCQLPCQTSAPPQLLATPLGHRN